MDRRRLPPCFSAALITALSLCGLPAPAGAHEAPRVLRVCADPNNLPFSNERGEGFENKIVELIARELDATLTYIWWAQRRGFVRNTLSEGLCDLVSGIASGMELLRNTHPYYRSAYVFVTRENGPSIQSLDDPVLETLKIGVQVIGEDGSQPPPAHALARRGIVNNVRGYSVYGDYGKPNPAATIMEAVAGGEIDVAVVWGPLAGYFAQRESVKLRLQLVTPEIDGPYLPMFFDITMGVRLEDDAFRDEINGALRRLRPEIDAILAEYGVPRLDQDSHAQATQAVPQ